MKIWKRLLGQLITLVMTVTLVGGYIPVHAGSGNTYTEGVMTINDYFKGGDLETTIGEVSTDYTSITELTINDGVVNAADFHFMDEVLTNLEVLIINGFAQVDSDTDDTVYDGIIPSGAMDFHDSLAYVEISVATEIGQQAFRGLNNLTEVRFENVTTLWEMGLGYNTNLTSVNMPKLEYIKTSGLSNAENLETLSLPELLEVSSYGMGNLTKLTSLEVPKLATIAANGFEYMATEVDGGINLDLPSLTTISSGGVFKAVLVNELHMESLEYIADNGFYIAQINDLYTGTNVPTTGSDDLFYGGTPGTLHILDTAADDYRTDTQDGNGMDEYWFGFLIDEIGTDPYLEEANIYIEGEDSFSFDGDDTGADTQVTARHGIDSFRLTVTADDDVMITVNDEPFDGDESFSLPVGTNDYVIMITAEDGVSTSTTSFEVVREEAQTYTIEDDFDTGSLEAHFSDAGITDNHMQAYTSLIVSVGTLSHTDFDFIMDKFLYLENLTLNGSATVEDDYLDYLSFHALELVEVEMTNVEGIGDEVFHDMDSLEKAHFDAALDIGFSAFGECDNLSDISFASAEFIDEEAFINTPILTSFDFDSVETIEEMAFQGSGLTSLYLPNEVELNQEVFAHCECLTTVTMSLVEAIPSEAFYNASSLTEITLGKTIPSVGTDAFYGLPASRTLVVPAGYGDLYDTDGDSASDGYWNGFTITELSDEATLVSLEVAAQSMWPSFSSDLTSYECDVTNDIDTVDLLAVTTDSAISITINDMAYTSCDDYSVSLDVGSNVFTIVVTAEDGETTGTYTLTITREEAVDESDDSEDETEDDSNDDSHDSNNNNRGSSSSAPPLLPIMPQGQTDDKLLEIISSGKDSTKPPTPIILDAAVQGPIGERVFRSLKESGASLEIKGDGFTWYFDGAANGNEEMSGAFDPGISFIHQSPLIDRMPREDAIHIQTRYDGILPFQAKLTIDVPDMGGNRPVLLYYFNEPKGKLELAGRAENKDGKVTFVLTHCSSYVIIDAPVLVEDHETVAYISGYNDGTFRPDKTLSRAETAAMLVRLLEIDGDVAEADFSDIGMWAEDSINRLVALGIISGYGDQTYRPDNTITRAEFAVLLSRMLALDTVDRNPAFTDIKGHWAEDAISAIARTGITNGYPDGSFRPDDPVTRIEAVTLINRALGRDHKTTGNTAIFYNDVAKTHWGFMDILNASGK